MSELEPKALSLPEVRNFVFQERPKCLALAWSTLGDCRTAERVFRELVAALDERPDGFLSLEALEAWCWKAIRNRCHNLLERGTYRRFHLPSSALNVIDAELRRRDPDDVQHQADALRPCLGLLPRRARWVLQIFCVEGKRGLEAARLLNVKPGSFYRDLQRIFSDLTKCQQKRLPMGRVLRPWTASRKTEFERQAFRFLDDELSAEGVREFTAELMANNDRVHQLNDIRIFLAIIRDSDVEVPLGRESTTTSAFPPEPLTWRRGPVWALSFVVATLVVALLAVLFSLIRVQEEQNPGSAGPTPISAVFVSGKDARFFGQEPPQFGDPLSTGTYLLSNGSAELRFAKGAQVSIAAPAEFTIRSDDALSVHQGTFLTDVPEEAKEFVVDTAFASINDMEDKEGSEFGVAVEPEVGTDIVVFKGKVEVRTESALQAYLVEVGKGLRLSNQGSSGLVASKEAARFPGKAPGSDSLPSAGNLLQNPSFENGALGKTPHSTNRYRHLPTAWNSGLVKEGRWHDEEPPPDAGTVVLPSTNQPNSPLLQGERCLYLDGSAVRQPVGSLQPRTRYELSVSIATSLEDKTESKEVLPDSIRECEVGLMTKTGWLISKKETLSSTPGFKQFRFELAVPEQIEQNGDPIFLALSAKNGTVFFDQLQLSQLSVAR